MRFAMTFVIAFAAITLLACVGIRLDLMLNPWIMKIGDDWYWYNYFTSHHALTVAYSRSWLWLIYP